MSRANPPLLAVVGETASGKSSLALRLAQRFNGEIICADSRTVYKGLDISTAKPGLHERRLVKHHLLDVAAPDQRFSAADFKNLAQQAITDISSRGKLAIMVGGSGLYVDAVLYDYVFRPKADGATRQALLAKTVDELQAAILEQGLTLPENARNRRHLVRRLETGGDKAVRRNDMRRNTLVIGLRVDPVERQRHIAERVDAMLEAGLVPEIEQLLKRYDADLEALQTPAIKAFRGYIAGQDSLENARQQFVKNDLSLAKRQRTWFRRNKGVHWFSTPVDWDNVVELVTTYFDL